MDIYPWKNREVANSMIDSEAARRRYHDGDYNLWEAMSYLLWFVVAKPQAIVWFKNFKKWTGIQPLIWHGEAMEVDMKATEDYFKTFFRIVAAEWYILEQVFNCDETVIKENLYNSRKEESVQPQTYERWANPCNVH